MVRAVSFAALALAGCTLSNPVGTQCLSDQNCGCANCCIAFRCIATGPNVDQDGGTDSSDAGFDAGTLHWRVETFVGPDAGLNAPTALVIDASGNLFVADTNNNCVRKVDAAANVTTVAEGAAPCGGSGLTAPEGLAVDKRGNLYVSDTGRNCIVKLAAGGATTFTVLAGSCSATGSGCVNSPAGASLAAPIGLAVYDPVLLIADIGNHSVRWARMSDGVLGSLAGRTMVSWPQPLLDGACSFGASCGPSSPVTFNGPSAVAMAGAATAFVADARNCALRKITLDPACLVETIGPRDCPTLIPEQNMSQLLYPGGVAVPADWETSGLVYATDQGNHRIASVDAQGTLRNVAGSGIKGLMDGPGELAQFNAPRGLAIDSAGRIFVADTKNNRIRMLTPELR